MKEEKSDLQLCRERISELLDEKADYESDIENAQIEIESIDSELSLLYKRVESMESMPLF